MTSFQTENVRHEVKAAFSSQDQAHCMSMIETLMYDALFIEALKWQTEKVHFMIDEVRKSEILSGKAAMPAEAWLRVLMDEQIKHRDEGGRSPDFEAYMASVLLALQQVDFKAEKLNMDEMPGYEDFMAEDAIIPLWMSASDEQRCQLANLFRESLAYPEKDAPLNFVKAFLRADSGQFSQERRLRYSEEQKAFSDFMLPVMHEALAQDSTPRLSDDLSGIKAENDVIELLYLFAKHQDQSSMASEIANALQRDVSDPLESEAFKDSNPAPATG